MKPIVRIVDTIQERDGATTREKVISVFGITISKLVECYPLDKNRAVGFTSAENNLTYIEDD